MLKWLFQYFDSHFLAYWIIAVGSSLLLIFGVLALLLRPQRYDQAPAGRTELWLFLLLLAGLFAWRWPYLLAAHEMSPDESQQIAGAITLRHDPVFWRSVDGATAGPLNYYILLLPSLLGAPLDFFQARLLGLFLAFGSIWFGYLLLRSIYGPRVAAMAILPGFFCFALTTDWDFLHYSSEHLSIFLVSLTAYLFWKHRPPAVPPDRVSRMGWFAAGLLAGLLPWCKLQAVPFSLLFLGGGLWLSLRSGGLAKNIRAPFFNVFSLGFITPTIVALGLIWAAGEFGSFYTSYIVQNFSYSSQGLDLRQVLGEFTRLTTETWLYPLFLLTPIIAVVGAFLLQLRQRTAWDRAFWAAGLLVIVACFIILAPRRGFPHYLLFLIGPLTLWTGTALGVLAQLHPRVSIRRGWLISYIVLAGFLPLGQRMRLPPPFMLGQLAAHWREPAGEIGRLLQTYSNPGDSLAVWGWYSEAYVQCGLFQAVRDAHSQRQIESSPLRDYFRQRYLGDFTKNQPILFVDAVGPGAFGFEDRTRQAHETFPELQRIVHEQYTLIKDLGYSRVYVRR